MHANDTVPILPLPRGVPRGSHIQHGTLPYGEIVSRLGQVTAHVNEVYRERDMLLSLLLKLARGLHLPLGLTLDPTQVPGWQSVVFLTLPSGQVSFRIPDEHLHFFADLPMAQPSQWDPSSLERSERCFRVLFPGLVWMHDAADETELALDAFLL